MQILLIRHGESEDDFLEENYEGSTDLPLTIKGVEQVEKMCRRVSEEFPPEFIWSSTLIRASKTAETLSNTIRCPVTFLDELREMQDRESESDFRLRAQNVLSHLRENSANYKRIAVVSHGGMITKLIESFLQLPHEIDDVWFNSNNTGIHLLEYTEHPYKLIRFLNSTTHLN
ncbi:histidine phosphatase family protein [Peribacillus sp. NJ4]|uniref:histidine phosphatase family protein n=1 Tax=Peribacillus TaxID=2675229 RepID=UPI0025A0A2CD|nr:MULTISPECIES: histidine phosphatase family protein [unclassified Peribacillus]MDM5211043.1 histidine phosphatase family protein [Peribacillus sp. NJ4]MDM5221358.1 histidine phosphatase family protein [Peribacillus sp. NJ11]